MKTAAFIPIKTNSERVKGKNFSKLCGKKLYEHIIYNSLEADCFDSIYVDTDSEEIKEHCKKVGVSTIDRDPKLTRNDANGNDVLNYDQEKYPNYDLYFQLFATAPFLSSETISECVRKLSNTQEYDSIFTVTEESGWYWMDGMPVNYRPSILPRSQDAKTLTKESTGLYGIFKESLVKYKCRIGAKPILHKINQNEAIDLDTAEDFLKAQRLCQNEKS